jgi:hypothetical protein
LSGFLPRPDFLRFDDRTGKIALQHRRFLG